MSKKRSGIGFSKSSVVSSYKQQSLLKAIIAFILVAGVIFLLVFLIIRQNRLGNYRSEIIQFWENGSYDEAYRLTGEELEIKPMDFFLLTMHGFSSYQLALAQINNYNTQVYIDACIEALRKSLLLKEAEKDARVWYVLGKAYYFKGPYYADLAVKYLEAARNMNYEATDLPEYLGLAYAAIQDYRSSIAALSLSLDASGNNAGISDLRLLTIAQSYVGLSEYESARAYLIQCIEISKDEDIALNARLLLGTTLLALNDLEGAASQFALVNGISGGNAEAYFQLGEMYAAAGDTVKARAEWRNAVRVDPSHIPSRERLNSR
jgi:tetratricopeptide (TPR) repeat protein